MKANELIDKLEDLTEETFAPETWYSFINDVLRDMTPGAKVFRTVDVEAELDGEDVELSISEHIPDAYEVVTVAYKPDGKGMRTLRKLSLHDHVSMGWIRTEDTLRVQNIPWGDGEVHVGFYEKLKLIEGDNDYTHHLPEEFEEILMRGVAAMAMQKVEDYERKADFYGEYMIMKDRMAADRIFEIEPWNRAMIIQAKLGGGRQ